MLWTSHWRHPNLARRDDLVKVSTSIGAPRRGAGFPWARLSSLTPYGLFKLDGEEFDRAYRRRLERAGAANIHRQLVEISDAHDGRELVLLCWEDVWRDGDDACHRRTFARWWLEQTGELVEELPPPTLRNPIATS